MRSVLWVMAVVCSVLALMCGMTTFVPSAFVNGMWAVIAIGGAGALCAIIAGVMRPRHASGILVSAVIVLFNICSILEAALAITRHHG